MDSEVGQLMYEEICTHCSKQFQHKYSLNRHLKIVHSGFRPYSCECGRTFATREQFLRHQNAKHTFQKPFKCERGCDKSFASHSARIYHHKIVHDNQKFRCPLLACTKEYSSKLHLRRHQEKPHDLLILKLNDTKWFEEFNVS